MQTKKIEGEDGWKREEEERKTFLGFFCRSRRKEEKGGKKE